MKGLVFNVAEEVVTDLCGEYVWDSLLESVNFEGAYTSLGNYDDIELTALVEATAECLELGVDETWRVLGRHMLPRFVERLGEDVQQFGSAFDLLRAVNDIIHPNVKAIYPDAAPPIFEISDTENGLLMRYLSERGLVAFAEGLIEGSGRHFGQVVTVERLSGQSTTDCLLSVSFGESL